MSAIDRIVFFGTPEFAVPTLAALVAAGRAPVRVVTQPARPAGRGQRLQDPPVARWARERGLPVSQPERVREPAFLEELASLTPDVAVVVAFGQIFPRPLLDLPRLGCINLHASLLPRWRGASPIQAAVAAGDARTGVSTMLMGAGLDTGPVLLEEATEIGPRETAGDLSRRLAEAGGALMVRTLQELERGLLVPRPQPPEGATYASRLTRESGRIDWSLTALEIHHRLRAYTPWPGLTAELRGAPVKIPAAEVLEGGAAEAAPGTYLGLRGGRLAVACGGSVLGIVELQRPGKWALRAPDFANGERLQVGERFA
ncbi:MAG TPA: methionyl-tRNA formyltransferase [Thermoanaerobaculia bacterium]|nr:methionyl-tRNA formyltransferase [Thermoanaerobaculia bacterium]